MELNLKIIRGDITYPKSESIIIPANCVGIMNKGILSKIIKEGGKIIEREAKKVSIEKKVSLGDFFETTPGRLKRRGAKIIYHAVIKKVPNDFTSLFFIKKSLEKVFNKIVKDKVSSTAICGVGIDNVSLYGVADIMINLCRMFDDKIKIKIIDENEEFINCLDNVLKKW